MPLEIVRNDITKMQVDVVVNAANTSLQMGGGVCGAIFRAAGAEQLREACNEIGQCPVGQAVITEGFQLPAKQIIHTVGPIWRDGSENEEALLRQCYKSSLVLASSNGCESIAFPLISTGIYGYPKEKALQVATSMISEFLLEHEMQVYIVVYDKKAFGLSEKLFTSIHQYIDEHYVEEQLIQFARKRLELREVLESQVTIQEASKGKPQKRRLEDLLGQLDESFSERLLRLIDEKKMTDVETYKKANIDRRLFSKIRNSRDYTPLKKTVIGFVIALELNLDETIDLLSKAGYTLSHSNKFDLIIKYFIEEENYNIHEINEALFAFDQVLLGA
ncbi:macro domain-containing protein [Psychrobacillus sp. L4]|uniref:macro domain-containing protein n=1 Tax=Psychrobacillus sp. L4 TaxID=3236892 RepID=UPI0036F39C78